jgi:hypothetical protein
MTVRPLAALGLLLACTAVVWAQTPAPKSWKPPGKAVAPAAKAARTDSTAKPKKPLHYVDGVLDTGQFVPDTTVLGRIDDHVFRVRDFNQRWFSSYIPDRPKSDSTGRLEFLNSMINKEVLADLARQVNRPFNFEDRARLRETRERMLSNAVFARFVADSVRVTPEDVQHLFDQSGYRLHLQQIVSAHPGDVEAARAAVLSKTMTWSEAVKKYSSHNGDQGPDGDIGWLRRMDFGPAPALEIFDLPQGGISSIFRDEPGWRFVQVVGRRSEPQPAFSVVARGLADEFRDVQTARRIEVIRAGIRRSLGVVYDTTNIAWAADLFRATEQQADSERARNVIDIGGAVPEFQSADTSRVLARWNDGGRFTLLQFLEAFNATPPLQRDRIGSFNAFRSTLDRFIFAPFMTRLGEERGLGNDPIVTEALARTEEQVRVEHLYSDSVESHISITPKERRDFYQAHLANYHTWQSVTFAAITRPNRPAADSLAARLEAGGDPAAILRADSLAGQVSGSIRSVRQDEKNTPYYKVLFEEMRPGSVVVMGPDKQGVWIVMQKLVHDPGRQLTYEECQGWVDESLQNEHADHGLKALIARHRAGHVIEVHPELMRRFILLDK